MQITIEINPKYNEQGVPMCGESQCQWYNNKREGIPMCILDRCKTYPDRVCKRAWENYKAEKQHEHKGLWQLIKEAFGKHDKNTKKRMKVIVDESKEA